MSGRVVPGQRDRAVDVTGLGDDLDVGVVLQLGADERAERGRVVAVEDADHAMATLPVHLAFSCAMRRNLQLLSL